MATNEELAAAGDLLPLWEAVRRLVWKQARRWAGIGGAELEDLIQVGFIAMMEAVRTFNPEAGAFSTWLCLHIRREFVETTGQRRRDPLQGAVSLDVPLDEEDGSTLGELIPDPTAEAAVLEVAERDRRERIRAILWELPEDQRRAVVDRYYLGRTVDKKVHAAALRQLRHPSVSRRLRECR